MNENYNYYLPNLLLNCLNWVNVTGSYKIKICDVNPNDLSFTIKGIESEQHGFQTLVQLLFDSGKRKIAMGGPHAG